MLTFAPALDCGFCSARSEDRRRVQGRPVQPLRRPVRSGRSPSRRGHLVPGSRRRKPATGVSRDFGPLHRQPCANRCTRPAHPRRLRFRPGGGLAESIRAQPNAAPVHMPGNPGVSSMSVAVPAWPAHSSGRQALAAPRPAGIQDLAAIARRHARAETMARLADPVRRLEGAFHRGLSRAGRGPYICGSA